MKFAAALCFVVLSSASALAQTATPAKPSAPSCTPPGDPKQNAPLGDKLSDTKGVICPPENHDSGIKVPTPDTGTKMPVIKPPADAK